MSGLLAGIKTNQTMRYVLLAGTLLATMPQASMAASALPSAERVIILAQAQAIDPATGKPLPKGVQPKAVQPQPKAVQPQPKAVQGGQPPGGQPPAGQSPAGQPPTGAGTPPSGVQQRQIGGQPKGPVQGQQNIQPNVQQNIQQGQQTPTGQGTPPSTLQKKQIGVQPKGTLQGQQNIQPSIQQGGGTPTGQGTPPAGVQQRQIGVQQKGIQTLPGQQNIQPNIQQNIQQGGAAPTGQGTPPAGLQQRQLGVQQKGIQPLQGAQPLPSPAGAQPLAVTGNVDQLRMQRQERKEAGGRVVIEEPGRRFIVREGSTTIIRHDETARFHLLGGAPPRMERRGAEQFAYIGRPGGYQIVNVTDADGRLLRRMRRGPDGREVIIIDNRGPGLGVGLGVGVAAGVFLGLAAPAILIPREQYIVDVSAAPAPLLYETLEAPPLVAIERPYSLDEIRYNVALRDRMRRIDIDSITFDTGSWEVTPEQQPRLQTVAEAILRVLSRNPNEVFMIEGHTDAVGNDVDNLSLSDRRAESVAVILTNAYQIPPENLVTQGYGAQHLKIQTDGPSRENRRVTARRITPLLQGGVAAR